MIDFLVFFISIMVMFLVTNKIIMKDNDIIMVRSDYDNINLVSEYITHSDHSVHNVYIRPETNLVIMSYYVDGIEKKN